MDPATIALLAGAGLSGGSLLASLIGGGGRRGPSIDVQAELDKISGIYQKAGATARSSIAAEAGRLKKSAASDLAARGILSSPVSENVFSEIRREELGAIANSEASLAREEAGARGALLRALLGESLGLQQLGDQRSAARTGAIGGLGMQLLMAALGMRGAGIAAPRTPGQVPKLGAANDLAASLVG